jgi:hypothetical protein
LTLPVANLEVCYGHVHPEHFVLLLE